jgi:hypothetical protein
MENAVFNYCNFYKQKLVLSYAKPDAPITTAAIKYIG